MTKFTHGFVIAQALLALGAAAADFKSRAVEAEIRDVAKRNAQYQKLNADARVAAARVADFTRKWAKDCESAGKILSVVQGDGRLDCVDKPQPTPPPPQEQKK